MISWLPFEAGSKVESGCPHDAPTTCLYENSASVSVSLPCYLRQNSLPLEPSPLGGRAKVTGKVSGRLFLKCRQLSGERGLG